MMTPRLINASLRMAATAELKARGIRYIFIRPGDYGADDFAKYSTAWGLTLAGEANGSRVYLIR
jgi:hypothetical protein